MKKILERMLLNKSILKYLLVALLLGRLFLSVHIFQEPEQAYYDDSSGYEMLATGILDGESYTLSSRDASELLRSPGYPAFIAFIYYFLGRSPGNVIAVQLLLGGLSALLVYKITSGIYSEKAGLFAGLILMLDPTSTWWAMGILTEALFMFLIILSLYLVFCWKGSGKRHYLILAGVFAGLGVLVRPIGLILLPFWTLFVLIFALHQGGSKVLLKSTILFVVGWTIVVLPWMIRNNHVWGKFTVSSISSLTLKRYMAPAVYRELEGLSWGEARERVAPPTTLQSSDEEGWYVRIILENPAAYLKAHMKGTLLVLFDVEYIGWLKFLGHGGERPGVFTAILAGAFNEVPIRLYEAARTTPIILLSLGIILSYQGFSYLLVIVGVKHLLGYKEERWTVAMLLFTVALLLLLPGTVGGSRFRVPAQPILAIIGGIGMTFLISRSKQKEGPSLLRKLML